MQEFPECFSERGGHGKVAEILGGVELFSGLLLRRREFGRATTVNVHGDLVMGDAVAASTQKGEICELVMAALGKLPESLAACSCLLREKNCPAGLLHEQDMFIDFDSGALRFFQWELLRLVGNTKISSRASETVRCMW